jgi:hypothetical protein
MAARDSFKGCGTDAIKGTGISTCEEGCDLVGGGTEHKIVIAYVDRQPDSLDLQFRNLSFTLETCGESVMHAILGHLSIVFLKSVTAYLGSH